MNENDIKFEYLKFKQKYCRDQVTGKVYNVPCTMEVLITTMGRDVRKDAIQTYSRDIFLFFEI